MTAREDYDDLESCRETFPLLASETYAKLYHILPSIPTLPVACAELEEGLKTHPCLEDDIGEIKMLSWIKLSTATDFLGTALMRSKIAKVSRLRRAKRMQTFSRWEQANKEDVDVERDYEWEERMRVEMGSSLSISELKRLGSRIMMTILSGEPMDAANLSEMDWAYGPELSIPEQPASDEVDGETEYQMRKNSQRISSQD